MEASPVSDPTSTSATLKANATPKRKGSTLHRESEIKQEPPQAEPDDRQDNHRGVPNGCPDMSRHQPVAKEPQNEFERRLLQAKKLRKAPLPDVSNIPWYHPVISRHIAESLLLSKDIEDGTYLLRDSISSADSLTLSVRCKNSVKHYKVIWDGRQFCFGLGKFPTVEAFREHFDNQPIISGDSGLLVQLNHPYPHKVSEPSIYDETTVHVESMTPMNTTALQLSINSKEGYLTKLGQHRKNWKRRWFVLYRNELKYFNTKEDTQPLRVINLEDAFDVERDETAGKECCIRLMTSYRTFFMYATSEVEANEWVDILQWRLNNHSPR